MTTDEPTSGAQRRDRDTELFHRLCADDGVLVLPNAWDAASARIVERAGAAAVATTSGGVAWAVGRRDGGHASRDQVLDLIARTVAAVDVPVTADIEAGFADDTAGLAATVDGVIEAGAAGVNIEDSAAGALRPIAEQSERYAAVRAAAEARNRLLYVNARVDPYLLGVLEPEERFAETVRRALAYLDAGADGVFVPGVVDAPTIRRLVAEIPAPLNIMAGPGAPSVGELAALGVRRVSVGTALAQAAYTAAERGARELLTNGTYGALEGTLDYPDLNSLFAAKD